MAAVAICMWGIANCTQVVSADAFRSAEHSIKAHFSINPSGEHEILHFSTSTEWSEIIYDAWTRSKWNNNILSGEKRIDGTVIEQIYFHALQEEEGGGVGGLLKTALLFYLTLYWRNYWLVIYC